MVVDSAVAHARAGFMTQGTIFSCAIAEDYPDCDVYGILITARCDIAQDKVRTYNYLPVVRLDDWIHRDGRMILAQRVAAEAMGGLRQAIKDAGYSPAILDTEPPRSVLDVLFKPGTPASKLRDRYIRQLARYEIAGQCINSGPEAKVSVRLANEVPKSRDVLIEELVHQKLAGYYFLKHVEPEGDDIGYVALVREIHTMPRVLAGAIAQGLENSMYTTMCDSDRGVVGRLHISKDGLAMPVGLVRPPYLEHLMQSFSNLFGRIGLPDPEVSYIAALWGRQPTISGGA
jgi:hypothetical protein